MRKTILFFAIAAVLLQGCSAMRRQYIPEQSDETINLGYGEIPAEQSTHSVGHVKNKDTRTYNSIYDYFKDKVPGVRVEMNGPRSASVFVRGINSINLSTEPLFIVDGVAVNDISSINPYDVESVDVLKDASAAIYGVRGANGVVLIKLKKAKAK